MRMQIVVFAKAKKRNYDLFCDFRQALRPGFFRSFKPPTGFVGHQQRSGILRCFAIFVKCSIDSYRLERG